MQALDKIVARRLNVSATEEMIEKMLEKEGEGRATRKRQRLRGTIKDLRLFYNSVERAMEMVRRCGVSVKGRKEEAETEIRYIISIAK